MKITTRITLGLLLVTALTVAALAHQLTVVQKLQGINRELSLTKLEAARISLRLLQQLDGVQEFVAKSLILGDADYYSQWAEWDEAVEDELIQLHALELAGREDAQRQEVAGGWEAYRRVVEPLRSAGPGGSPGTASLDPPLLEEIDRRLETVRSRLEGLMSLTDAAVAAHARSSAEAGDRAQAVSLVAGGSAMFLAALICILLYLSISGPLRALTGGTRELARGNFDHRLKVKGEDELSELARAFNRMARQLDELEEMKRDFASHVSHELKGPLAAIHETIHVLLDEIPGPLNEEQAHFLRLSWQSSERLSRMISNLLEISRLEAGGAKYRARPEDLAEICHSVVEEHGPVARERGVRLSISVETGSPPSPESPWGAGSSAIFCDGDRVRELVANLVGNAIKFSPSEGRVEVRLCEIYDVSSLIPSQRMLSLRGEVGPFLLLSVEDEGIGVADGHKEGIFEKFHQVKVEGRVKGQGVGLGLSISRSIAESHGGAVWVEDGPERGSVFRVLLPRVPSRWKEQAFRAGEPPPAPGSGTRAPAREYTQG